MNDQLIEPSISRQRGWKIACWVMIGLSVLSYLIVGQFLDHTTPQHWFTNFFLAPLVFLSCLMGAYAGLGNFVWRWPVILISTPILGWHADYSTGSVNLLEFEIFVGGIVGVVALTTFILRCWKGSLVRIELGDTTRTDALQFGIKHLLIWTTAAAITIAIAQAISGTQPEGNIAGGYMILFPIAGMSASIAIAAVIDIWALFGSQLTSGKFLVVVLFTFASAAACHWLICDTYIFSAAAITNQFLVVILMLFLRRLGFRFVKPNK